MKNSWTTIKLKLKKAFRAKGYLITITRLDNDKMLRHTYWVKNISPVDVPQSLEQIARSFLANESARLNQGAAKAVAP